MENIHIHLYITSSHEHVLLHVGIHQSPEMSSYLIDCSVQTPPQCKLKVSKLTCPQTYFIDRLFRANPTPVQTES